MGSLRDQFKKAGILSNKDAKRLAHEARIERTAKGNQGLEQEAAARQAELQALRQEQRRAAQEAQAQLDAQREQARRLAELRELVLSRALRQGGGPRRFHFVARSGAVPFVAVDQDLGKRLEAGQLGIVVEPSPRAANQPLEQDNHLLVDRAVAQKVREVEPELVRFLAGVTGTAT
jgi:uncharacterized protein YaiL (DUF2058 family)